MRTQVKICGINTAEALSAAIGAGADAVGFVFFLPSPRAVAPDRAAGLAARAGGVRKVGLFVDADDMLIDAAVRAAGLDVLQLHGTESPQRVAAVRQRFGLPVWKAAGVRTEADIAAAARAYGMADALLLDAKAAEGAALPGGNGLRFDWRALSTARPAMPWILAGGLDPDNVAEAIRLTGADFVDVSSGVESAPGVKNLAKIAAFTQAARRA